MLIVHSNRGNRHVCLARYNGVGQTSLPQPMGADRLCDCFFLNHGILFVFVLSVRLIGS